MNNDVGTRYVRICWNTKDWKYPTGEAAQIERRSFAKHYGYGHEEWLFRSEWLMPGLYDQKNKYRYSYVTPIGKHVEAWAGKQFDIVLWTISPAGRHLVVGRMNNVCVPDKKERMWASKRMAENGWKRTMIEEASEVAEHVQHLDSFAPNIRFQLKDVHLLDAWIDATDGDLAIAVKRRSTRYMPYLCTDEEVSSIARNAKNADRTINFRSTKKRFRKPVDGTAYDPRHELIQQALHKFLSKRYAGAEVNYEKDFVDLSVVHEGRTTFIEVKTDNSARLCVRHALGQILEYAYYADKQKAHELLIVGDAAPQDDDKRYMRHLREKFRLPVYYSQFSWETSEIGDKY